LGIIFVAQLEGKIVM